MASSQLEKNIPTQANYANLHPVSSRAPRVIGLYPSPTLERLQVDSYNQGTLAKSKLFLTSIFLFQDHQIDSTSRLIYVSLNAVFRQTYFVT